MKWIKLVIDIALVLIPGLGLKAKKDLEKKLEIAKATIQVLSKGKTSSEKGQAVEEAIGNILRLPGVKPSVVKFINKSKGRLYDVIF